MIDTTASDARRAVADVVRRLEPLRGKVAVIVARTERPVSLTARGEMLDECAKISLAFQQARVDLIHRLIDAPRKVVSHSRVADVERAIDNLEAATLDARRRLEIPN